MNKMSIKKDDLVVVLSGKYKGKQGKVLEVMPKSGKVVVEKVPAAEAEAETIVEATQENDGGAQA